MTRILIALWAVGLATFSASLAPAAEPSGMGKAARAPRAAAAPSAVPASLAAAATPGGQVAASDAVRQLGQQFTAAFNAGDSSQIAALFFDAGEVIDDAGDVFRGAAAIKDAFDRFFQKFPGAQSTMTPESVWLIGPGLAIEEGTRTVTCKDGTTSAGSRYTLVMIREQDRWKIAAAREMGDDSTLTPHDHLAPLGWLVGDWVDEDSDAVVEISCKWSEDRNFLLVDFLAKVQGKPTLKSNQRIGWDPLTEKVKSWVFDSDGGHGEATWTQVDDHWVVKSSAVMPDGTTGSATIMLVPQGKDRYVMKGFDRIRGDTAEPDFEMVIVRRPPAPSK